MLHNQEYVLWDNQINRHYYEMTVEEAESIVKLVISSLGQRISMLQSLVCSTPGYKSWKPDYSDDSVLRLGSWVRVSLSQRHMRTDEKGIIWNNTALSEEIRKDIERRHREEVSYTFTDKSESINFDIGIYIGERLCKRLPFASWARCSQVHNVCYNKPIVRANDHTDGFDIAYANYAATHIFDRRDGEDSLLRLAALWESNLQKDRVRRRFRGKCK
jgi:hypothetical protein